MIPFLFKNVTRSLKMPALSGGVNKRDGLSLINDDQLTDVLNLWFKDGMLKTRPSVSSPTNYETSNLLNIDIDGATVIDVKVFKNILVTLPGSLLAESLYTFLVIKYKYKAEDEDEEKFYLKPCFISLDDRNIKHDGIGYSEDVSFFAYAFNNEVYMFVSGETVKDIYKVTTKVINEATNEVTILDCTKLAEEDIYAPLVLTNGKPLGNDANTTSGGDQIYGYNLLTRYYKAEYSTVDPNDDTLGMIFTLPVMFGDDHGKGCTVKAEWTRDDGKTYTYEVVLDEDGYGETEEFDNDNGVKMRVDKGSVEFFDEEWTATDTTFIKNNLVITAPGPYDEEQKKKVFDMTVSAWYGGAANGIFGGSRLFLGGNKNTKEQALIVWTDLNQPLYFSENNYAYVGDKGQGVVAFGNQESSLVILKEREIHYTYQAMNGNVTAEDIQNQNALDLSTLFAYFPITQIHSGIGCDSPDSVQMCKNRLVWTFERKVYTLTNQSQYSERNVFCVSEMLGRIEGNNYLSADCFDRYLLFSGKKAYVMDYNSYGYNYISSYQKTEDANSKIPWFIWKFPIEPKGVINFTSNEGMMFVCSSNLDGRAVVDIWSLHTQDDESGYDRISNLEVGVGNDGNETYYYPEAQRKPIHSSLQTKLFDFGLPSHFKNVNLVNVTFGNNHGELIHLSFISEANTTDQHTLRLMESEENERSPKYFHSRRFMPFTKSTVNFGIQIECDGNLSIGAVTLEYRMLGGAR